MAQILDPLPLGSADPITCCYVNATSQIQIARITNVPNWYFERVVFPGQRLVFEALCEGQLEIHTGMMASAILSDTIPCDRLRLQLVESIDKDCNPQRPSENVNNYEVPISDESTHASKQKVLASVD
ncbi:DUF1830 domain-containing protein [Zarconia navalis]|nr:DUF1830 domain-containing protein [Zarconia navalis]